MHILTHHHTLGKRPAFYAALSVCLVSSFSSSGNTTIIMRLNFRYNVKWRRYLTWIGFPVLLVLLFVGVLMRRGAMTRVRSVFGHMSPFQNNPDAISAEQYRQKLGESGQPFLGRGMISKKFADLSSIEAQALFQGKMMNLAFKCSINMKIGEHTKTKSGDRSIFEVCLQPPFFLEKGNCLIYSFGVRDNWAFDDSMKANHGCEIHSFDHTLGLSDHLHKLDMYFHDVGVWGWNFKNDKLGRVRDVQTIIKMLNHQDRVIDYLKLDIHGEEWPVLRHIVDSGVYRQIKQIGVDVHAPRLRRNPMTRKPEKMSVADYGEVWQTLHDLEKVGFRQFAHEAMDCCDTFATLTTSDVLFGRKPHCCYRVVYVNVNFIPLSLYD